MYFASHDVLSMICLFFSPKSIYCTNFYPRLLKQAVILFTLLYFVLVILLSQQGGLLVVFLESIYNKSFLFTESNSLLKVIQTVLMLLPGHKLEETSIQIASNRFPIISVFIALRNLPGKLNIALFCILSFFLYFFKKTLNVSEIIFT